MRYLESKIVYNSHHFDFLVFLGTFLLETRTNCPQSLCCRGYWLPCESDSSKSSAVNTGMPGFEAHFYTVQYRMKSRDFRRNRWDFFEVWHRLVGVYGINTGNTRKSCTMLQWLRVWLASVLKMHQSECMSLSHVIGLHNTFQDGSNQVFLILYPSSIRQNCCVKQNIFISSWHITKAHCKLLF